LLSDSYALAFDEKGGIERKKERNAPSGNGRVVRNLLSNVVPDRSISVVVAAPEDLAEDGVVAIERAYQLPRGREREKGNVRLLHALRFDVPPRQIVLQDSHESLVGAGGVLSAAERERGQRKSREQGKRAGRRTRRGGRGESGSP
jgi:hypothetical protein